MWVAAGDVLPPYLLESPKAEALSPPSLHFGVAASAFRGLKAEAGGEGGNRTPDTPAGSKWAFFLTFMTHNSSLSPVSARSIWDICGMCWGNQGSSKRLLNNHEG